MTDLLDIRRKVKEGLEVGEAVILLHGLGFTVVESMRFLVDEYGLTLAEAKRIVSGSPVWSEVVAAAAPLQDDIVNFLGEDKGEF
ncbi:MULTISPECIES: hypothetical protein [unclassified Pseudomonas]|uniref:hypothetical protein n=1 Tax=Pseudomonas TaxID=286 RepID=UPI001179B115|nr:MULTISPECIES: hypothetical protein [unclassified Pseudomonas]